LSHPERPYISWIYTNGNQVKVDRNNREIFFEATNHMSRAMPCHIANKHTSDIANVCGIEPTEAGVIQ
jgi:hypothetical protein